MTLRFIVGRAGTGKTMRCLAEIKAQLQHNLQGPALIFVVPEQGSFQTELALATGTGQAGFMRAQVLSFRRLGWKVFSETGGAKQVSVGELGKRMILSRLLLHHRHELRAFARAANRPGMADRLAQAIGEFKMYRVRPADLQQIDGCVGILQDKLADLALLYLEFEKALGEERRDPDDELTLLADKLGQAPTLCGASVWIDGFKGFTPQEFYVLARLMPVAATVTVSLAMDPALMMEDREPQPFAAHEELFWDAVQTYRELRRLAAVTGTAVEAPVILNGPWRFKCTELEHLEKFFFYYPTVPYSPLNTELIRPKSPASIGGGCQRAVKPSMDSTNIQWGLNPPLNEVSFNQQGMLTEANRFNPYSLSLRPQSLGSDEAVREQRQSGWDGQDGRDLPNRQDSGPVQLVCAVNRRTEIEGVARQLRRLARDERMRWREMAVAARSITEYQELIEKVFSAYEIPYFLDAKRNILHHPLPEFLLAVLEVASSDWAYEPLFRCLKTGFFPLSREAVDRLENYCLAHGLIGADWRRAEDWTYAVRRERAGGGLAGDRAIAEVNAGRRTVRRYLMPFVQAVGHGDGLANVRTVTAALYDLLERLGVPERLEELAAEAAAQGRLADSRLQVQMWDAVVGLFDELVAGLGDEQLALADYAAVLATGLENLGLGLIPPALDQVTVGTLDRSRHPEVRVLFLIGASEGVLPARPAEDGLLDGVDREKLTALGINLAPKGKSQVYEEQNYIYTALTRASERLIVSYPLTDEEGKEIGVSPVVPRIKSLFPQLPESLWGNPAVNDQEVISHPEPLLAEYARRLATAKGKGLPPEWSAVRQWLANDPRWQGKLALIDSGPAARNQVEKIPRALARRLYGKRLLASVSRLEQFAACPFGHYARYGLRLREQDLFKLSRPDVGQFFHALLRDFAAVVLSKGMDWGDLSSDESRQLIEALAANLTGQHSFRVMNSNARYRYLNRRLQRTAHQAVRLLGEYARRGVFTPIQLEVGFGPGMTLPGPSVPLSEGDSLVLQGQIDRVDGAIVNGQAYVRIIDYKSAEKNLKLDSIYYGLDLQLLTYLDVALRGAEILFTAASGEPVHPAGFLYFPVIEKELTDKAPLSEDEIAGRRLQALRINGYLLADPAVLQAMDNLFAQGQTDLLGFKLTNKGEFPQTARVLRAGQFDLLRRFLYHLVQNTGEQIMSGEVSISPYRRGHQHGCQYCAYKPVCRFDPLLPENTCRNLPTLKNDEIWTRIGAVAEAELPWGQAPPGPRLDVVEEVGKSNEDLQTDGCRKDLPSESNLDFWLDDENGEGGADE